MSAWVIGIGCRRGVSGEQIHAAVLAALGNQPITNLRALASIDRKHDETALLEFAALHHLPIEFFSKERVALVQMPASEQVRALIGIDGVCEPCALLASRDGRIVRPKIAMNGVTVAIAEDKPNQQPDNERTQ
jgi:cobalt-precorrin 5A hydrolase